MGPSNFCEIADRMSESGQMTVVFNEICIFRIKMNKKVKDDSKKYFNQLSGACSTQKLVEIHNIQPSKLE